MKQYSDHYSLKQHKSKDHDTLYKCDLCDELEASEPAGIGYLCCVCDAEFEVASKLEEHMLTHDNYCPDVLKPLHKVFSTIICYNNTINFWGFLNATFNMHIHDYMSISFSSNHMNSRAT